MKRQTNVYNKETRRQLTKLWLHSDVPETIHQTCSNINPNTEYSTQACAWPEHFFLESLVVELAKTIVAELSLCLLADSCLLRWVSDGCVCTSSQALAARGDGSSPTCRRSLSLTSTDSRGLRFGRHVALLVIVHVGTSGRSGESAARTAGAWVVLALLRRPRSLDICLGA